MKKGRILFFSDCYIFGGCENILASLLASPALKAAHEVTFSYRTHEDYRKGVALRVPVDVPRRPLFLMSNESLFHRLESSAGGKGIRRALIRAPFLLAQRLRIYPIYNFFALWLWFKRAAPDLLHINNGGYPGAASARVAVLSAKLAGVPRIVFVVNNLALPPRNFLDRALDVLVRRFVDRFVTASSQVRTRLTETRSVDPSRIVQIYNTVRDSPTQRLRGEILAEYGFPSDCFLIVEVAFLTRRKGQINLLHALAGIRERDPAAFGRMRVLFVGDGEDRQVLEDYVRDNGLREQVRLAGFQADSSDFIRAADLFVLPSTGNEDMPLVILDAMRLGKAIISTEVAGIMEEIRSGQDGKLIPPGDVELLREAILGFFRDPGLRHVQGESARKRFEEVFSYRAFTDRYLDLYRDLMEGGRTNG